MRACDGSARDLRTQTELLNRADSRDVHVIRNSLSPAGSMRSTLAVSAWLQLVPRAAPFWVFRRYSSNQNTALDHKVAHGSRRTGDCSHDRASQRGRRDSSAV